MLGDQAFRAELAGPCGRRAAIAELKTVIARLYSRLMVGASPCIARRGHPNNVQNARPCRDSFGPFADLPKSQFSITLYRCRIGRRHTEIDTIDKILVKRDRERLGGHV